MWKKHLNKVRRMDYGEKLEIPKSQAPRHLPANFEQSDLSIHLGAKEVYREDRPEESIQLRVYKDKYVLQLDRHNPKYRPIRHAVEDATLYTAGALAVGAAIVSS
jgi:hypothetical protein